MAANRSLVEYQQSGNLGSGLILVPAVGIPVSIALSIGYAYGTVYTPIFGILTIFGLFLYLAGAGLTIGYLGKFAKCRNPVFLGLVGLLCGVIALYTNWLFFVYALVSKELPIQLADVAPPGDLWALLKVINEHGYYEVFGSTPTGTLLWVMWGLESLMILFGIPALALVPTNREMFCEDCGVWCHKQDARHLEITEELASANLQEIKLEHLIILEPLPEVVYPCIRCEVLRCPHCEQTEGLRFCRVSQTKDDKGNLTEKTEDIPGVWWIREGYEE